jgi:hypothetical protein
MGFFCAAERGAIPRQLTRLRSPSCGSASHFRDANTGAGQGITDLAAAVQLRLRVASGLQTFTVKSRLLTGENAVQFRGNPPFRVENAELRMQTDEDRHQS